MRLTPRLAWLLARTPLAVWLTIRGLLALFKNFETAPAVSILLISVSVGAAQFELGRRDETVFLRNLGLSQLRIVVLQALPATVLEVAVQFLARSIG